MLAATRGLSPKRTADDHRSLPSQAGGQGGDQSEELRGLTLNNLTSCLMKWARRRLQPDRLVLSPQPEKWALPELWLDNFYHFFNLPENLGRLTS